MPHLSGSLTMAMRVGAITPACCHYREWDTSERTSRGARSASAVYLPSGSEDPGEPVPHSEMLVVEAGPLMVQGVISGVSRRPGCRRTLVVCDCIPHANQSMF